jgi:hypothetical protein
MKKNLSKCVLLYILTGGNGCCCDFLSEDMRPENKTSSPNRTERTHVMCACMHDVMCVCVYACAYVCTCVCVCAHMHVCMYVRTYVRSLMYMRTCMRAWVHMLMCECVCVYVHAWCVCVRAMCT